MEEVLSISHLTKTYGRNRGVIDLSLSVGEGDIYGFLGPNGAGKSTTIRSILGLIHYQQGDIRVFGKDPRREKIAMLKEIGYMPSEVMYYPGMKAGQVIKLAADMRKLDCKDEARRLCEILSIDTEKKVEELSLGNRKKVSIVCAMQHKPKFLIFDEPTSGLDPLIQEAFFNLVLEYNREGTTCLYSSHVLSEVKKYCNNVAIIREGKLVACDSVSHLTRGNTRKVRVRGVSELTGINHMKNFKVEKGELSFVYSGDVNELIKALSMQSVEDVLIEEPSLEEIFMHFYEKEEERYDTISS